MCEQAFFEKSGYFLTVENIKSPIPLFMGLFFQSGRTCSTGGIRVVGKENPLQRWDQRMISLALPFCCQLACTAVPLRACPGVAAVGNPCPLLRMPACGFPSQGVDVTQVLPVISHWSFVQAKVMYFLKTIFLKMFIDFGCSRFADYCSIWIFDLHFACRIFSFSMWVLGSSQGIEPRSPALGSVES